MVIESVNESEYQKVISTSYHIFGSAAFNELNRNKVAFVHYLLFKDTKYRLGLILGEANNSFESPFSAPFGGFSPINLDISLSEIDAAIHALLEWCYNKGKETIKITLPPSVYNESFVSKMCNAFYRGGFSQDALDLNYHFPLEIFDGNYKSVIWRNARKNLNRSLASDLRFFICDKSEEKKQAYDVIVANRQARGFPLRMTWENICDTIKVIAADFFIVTDKEGANIAAAMVFKINEDIRQVVYWGDIPEYAHYKTMNFLSYSVFDYYKEAGCKIVDIGPSTENSIPNYGLCEFKESIGCRISTKIKVSKKI